VTILAIGLLAVVGQVGTLDSNRRSTQDTQEAQALLRTITERIATAQWESLRGDTQPWTYARLTPDSDGTIPPIAPPEASAATDPLEPMTTGAVLPGNDLVKQGLLNRNVTLRNVQVFLEYYRSISWFDVGDTHPVQLDGSGRPKYGLLCEGNPSKPATPAEFRALINTPSTRLIYLLNQSPSAEFAGSDPSGMDHHFDPVLVRIIITWDGTKLDTTSPATVLETYPDWKQSRRLEAWTGIRSSAAN
jgi:hypothetical protein